MRKLMLLVFALAAIYAATRAVPIVGWTFGHRPHSNEVSLSIDEEAEYRATPEAPLPRRLELRGMRVGELAGVDADVDVEGDR